MKLFDSNTIDYSFSNDIIQRRNKFRLEIRKEHNNKLFQEMRRQLLESLKMLNFSQLLEKKRNNWQRNQIEQLIIGLQNGKNDAEFNFKINQLDLEDYLCQLLYNYNLHVSQKLQIMEVLVHLAYYCGNSAQKLGKQALIQYLIKQMNTLSSSNIIHLNYLTQIVCLVENITQKFQYDLNYFIIESSFCQILNQKISQTLNMQKQLTQMLLSQSLKLYKNLFNKKNFCELISLKNIGFILRDHRFVSQHTQLLIKCLKQLAQNENFWQKLLLQQQQVDPTFFEIFKYIYNQPKNYTLLNQLLKLFLVILYQHQSSTIQYLNYCQIKLITQRIINAHYQNNCQSTIMIGLEFYKHILQYVYVTGTTSQKSYQLRDQFLQIITLNKYFSSPVYGRYVIGILQQMLLKDYKLIQKYMQIKILDTVDQLLNVQFNQILLIDTMNFLLTLIEVQKKQRPYQYNSIVRLLRSRNIIDIIETLQDHNNRDVYSKAQNFINYIVPFERQERI